MTVSILTPADFMRSKVSRSSLVEKGGLGLIASISCWGGPHSARNGCAISSSRVGRRLGFLFNSDLSNGIASTVCQLTVGSRRIRTQTNACKFVAVIHTVG